MKEDDLLTLRFDEVYKRWKPQDEYDASDFHRDLLSLMWAAVAAAQAPFRYELQSYRDQTLKTAMLTPFSPKSS
jgi:hypothetical protein